MYLSQPLHLNMVICIGAIEEGREEGNSGGQEGCRTEQGCEGKACENREDPSLSFSIQRIGGLERRLQEETSWSLRYDLVVDDKQ